MYYARRADTGQVLHIDDYLALSPQSRPDMVCDGRDIAGLLCGQPCAVRPEIEDHYSKHWWVRTGHIPGCDRDSRSAGRGRGRKREMGARTGKLTVRVQLAASHRPRKPASPRLARQPHPVDGSTLVEGDREERREETLPLAAVLRYQLEHVLRPDDEIMVTKKVKGPVSRVLIPAEAAPRTPRDQHALFYGFIRNVTEMPDGPAYLDLRGAPVAITLTPTQIEKLAKPGLPLSTVAGRHVIALGTVRAAKNGRFYISVDDTRAISTIPWILEHQ